MVHHLLSGGDACCHGDASVQPRPPTRRSASCTPQRPYNSPNCHRPENYAWGSSLCADVSPSPIAKNRSSSGPRPRDGFSMTISSAANAATIRRPWSSSFCPSVAPAEWVLQDHDPCQSLSRTPLLILASLTAQTKSDVFWADEATAVSVEMFTPTPAEATVATSLQYVGGASTKYLERHDGCYPCLWHPSLPR